MNDCFKNFTNTPIQVIIKEFSEDTCPTEPTRIIIQLPFGSWLSGEYTPLDVLIKMAEQNEHDEKERAEMITWLKNYRPYGEVCLHSKEWKCAARGLFMEIVNL